MCINKLTMLFLSSKKIWPMIVTAKVGNNLSVMLNLKKENEKL